MRKPSVGHPTGPTRDRILRSAGDLFARHGFTHVSMREVAAEASITKAGLYYHFRDKEALYAECLVDHNEELAATLRRAARCDGSMADRVRAVAAALLTESPFHPIRVHDELAEHVSAQMRERLRGAVQAVVLVPVVELFEDLRRRGELRGDVSPEVASAVLIGVCAAQRGWAPLPGRGVDEAAALVAGVVVHGLAGHNAGRG